MRCSPAGGDAFDFAWGRLGGGVEEGIELVFGEAGGFKGDLSHGAFFGMGFFGDGRGGVVADHGSQCGAHGEGFLDEGLAAFGVGFEGFHAAAGKDVHRVGEEFHTFDHRVGHEGHADVEFEGGEPCVGVGDGGVVADDLAADLDEHFAHDGVDFAGHDGGAGLGGGELEFADATTGAGAHPADVVGDFDEGGGKGFEGAAEVNDGVFGGLGFEVVGGFAEVEASFLVDFVDDACGELGVAVEAGADGGAAEGEFGEEIVVGCALKAHEGELHLAGVAGEFLTEADWGGVHEMGAADLEDVVKRRGFGVEGSMEVPERRDEALVREAQEGDVKGGGDDVVGGLAAVDVVVGVDEFFAALAAEEFGGAIGDDFVGVHVGGGAGAGLEDVDDEVVVELAGDDFVGGTADGICDVGGDAAEFLVHGGRVFFDEAEGSDECTGEAMVGDREVFNSACGGGSVEGVGGHLHGAHGVFFGAGV